MEYNDLLNIIKGLEFDTPKSVFEENGVEIFIVRPSKAFKHYDVNKNFQIFIKDGDRQF